MPVCVGGAFELWIGGIENARISCIPTNIGKLVKSMSPKLADYFIQMGRKIGQCILTLSDNKQDK